MVEEEVYDPYDMSLYANPKSQQDSQTNNNDENNISEKEKKYSILMVQMKEKKIIKIKMMKNQN